MVDRSKLGQFWLSDGFTAVAEKPITFCKDIGKVDQKVSLRVGQLKFDKAPKKVISRQLRTYHVWQHTSEI